MKVQLRLIAFLLLGFIVFAEAAPDTALLEEPSPAEATSQPGQDDSIENLSSSVEDAVGELLLHAMGLLGVAYRFGGNSPENGLDCSGFIRYVFQKSLKVNLPRTSAEIARVGKSINRSELVPGDLVFFNTRGFKYSHVGMYVGKGKFIHAPRIGKNIEVANINQGYWDAVFTGARRVRRGQPANAANTPEKRQISPLISKALRHRSLRLKRRKS